MRAKRLPLLVERAVMDTHAAQIEVSVRFERNIRRQALDGKRMVACTPGCHHCCYYPALISVLEGIGVLQALTGQNLWTIPLKQKLRTHAEQTFGLSYEVWLLGNIRCPLLDSRDRCIIYAARPFTCRTVFSIGDAHYCHPHRLITNSLIPRTEVITEFHTTEEALFKGLGTQHVLMPISKAILVADKVLLGEVETEGLNTYLAKEFGAHT